MMSDLSEKERMGAFLNKKFGLLEETESVTPQIRSIYYSVTGKCNLNCEFCTMNSGPNVSTKNDFTLQEIQENLIPKLKQLSPRKVIITGGEPLVRKRCK